MDENKEPIEEKEIIQKPEEIQSEIEDTSLGVKSAETKDTSDKTEEPLLKPINEKTPKNSKLKRFLHTKKGKAACVVLAILVIAGVLFAIPTTRYGILGTFIKKSVHIVVTDSVTAKPISQAMIMIGSKEVTTANNGEATIDNVPVGEYNLKVTKKYYKDNESSYAVPVFGNSQDAKLQLVATGRQVTVSVLNKFTQAPLEKATITVHGTSAVTNEKGVAVIVLPADQKTLAGTATLNGYNQADIEVKVTEQADANSIALTPAGTIFYLSKQTGKINVMKSQLDGSNASVVVAATGNELDASTVLLAARDWKYMALSAKRNTTQVGQLYLVDGTTGKLSTIDEGDAEFTLIGWADHRFIYKISRNGKQPWNDKQQALKSFNAETGILTTLDETAGIGASVYDYQNENIQSPYIQDNKIVYSKVWSVSNSLFGPSDKKSAIMSVNSDSSQKQRVKEFAMQRYISIETKVYEPQSLYYRVAADNGVATFYEYEAGAVKTVTNTDEKFYNTFYPTYLISPTGKKTFWYESRNGKNVLLVGDKDGKNTTELASQSDYTTFGWYSDDYILLSKNASELSIAPAGGAFAAGYVPFKVTNYHKPAVSFFGYGSGYGGGQ